MASAHKCAITGKLGEGEGVKVIVVEFGKDLKAELRFFEKHGGAFHQAPICQDEVAKIEAALKSAVNVKAVEPEAK